MSRPAIYTPEEAYERKLERTRVGVAKHTARLSSMTRLEQAVWKARSTLGADFVPYTPEEAEAVARVRAMIVALEKNATILNNVIRARLEKGIRENPALAPLLAELSSGTSVRLDLKPF